MDSYGKRYRQILFTAIIFALVSFLAIVARPWNNMLNAQQTATMAYVLTMAPTLTPTSTTTPTPSFTPTSTVTPTFSPTPSLTLTPSPTITSTSIVPCVVQLMPEADLILYSHPNLGVTQGRMRLESREELELYAQLDDEPWWLAVPRDKTPDGADGWIHASQIDPLNSRCEALPQLPLRAILGSSLAAALELGLTDFPIDENRYLIEETFSGFDYIWQAQDIRTNVRVNDPDFPEYQRLLLPRDETDDDHNAVRLDSQTIPDNVTLYFAFRRRAITFADNVYFAIRLVSAETPGSFAELRLYRKECGYSYYVFYQGQPSDLNRVDLTESARCEDDDSFLMFTFARDINAPYEVKFGAAYNDVVLQPFSFDDTQRLFSETYLEFHIEKMTGEIDYLLVVADEVQE